MLKRFMLLGVVLLLAGCGKMGGLPFADGSHVAGHAEEAGVEEFDGKLELFGKTVRMRRQVRLDAEGNYVKHGRAVAWYENGQKAGEMAYHNDKPNGDERSWYENGKKKLFGQSVEGLASGRWVEWYDNGQKLSEGEYVDGERNGTWAFWEPSGQLKETAEYRFGKKVGVALNPDDRLNR